MMDGQIVNRPHTTERRTSSIFLPPPLKILNRGCHDLPVDEVTLNQPLKKKDKKTWEEIIHDE